MWKSVYPYEWMDDWKKFNKISLLEKKDFYSHLNMEDITNIIDITRMEEDFEIKILGEYHDLHVQRNTLLLADVFEKFQNMCLKIYELDLAQFLTAPRLGWQAALKTRKNLIFSLISICY